MYRDKYGHFFGKRDQYSNIVILNTKDGSPATRMDAANVFPINYWIDSYGNVTAHRSLSDVRTERPIIILSTIDTTFLDLEIEPTRHPYFVAPARLP